MIEKPKYDKRIYEYLKLPNGIKCVLINDSELNSSTIAVNLSVGHYNNPKEFGGLAHFLEHVLFLGSKKYPITNHFFNKLAEYNGTSNAYTEFFSTNYYFNVYDNGLFEIIDIFSRFFIDPLFDEKYINKEINAVHNEHLKNINSDEWNLHQLKYYLINKDSTLNNFITGSKEILDKPNIREILIDFYNKYYNPKNISICIISSKSISDLKKIISDTFGNIECKENIIETSNRINKPFYSNNINKTYHIKTNGDMYKIYYMWEIPEYIDNYLTKDFEILKFILLYQSENSLYFYLKNIGYINYLDITFKNEGVFILSISVTLHGKNNLDLIEDIIFSTLNLIYTFNIKSIATYLKNINKSNFDEMPKLDTEQLCFLLSNNLHYFNEENLISSDFLIFEIKETNEYIDFFKKYINKNNFIKIIATPILVNEHEFTNLDYIKIFQYDLFYSFLHENTRNINKDLNLDLDGIDINNNYLNINTKFIPDLDKYMIPILYNKKQWYGGSSKYGEPIINILLHFNNSKYYKNIKNHLLTDICIKILNYLINIKLNKAILLNYNIYFTQNYLHDDISINISMPNDLKNLFILINEIYDFISNINTYFKKLSVIYIDNLLKKIIDDLNNIKFFNPSQYSGFLIKSKYSLKKLLRTTYKLKYSTIEKYIKNIFNESSLTTIIYGNIELNNDIKSLFVNYENFLNINNYKIVLFNNIYNRIKKHTNPKEKSNCISYFFKIGTFCPYEYVLLKLFILLVNNEFFNFMRTEKQLGYLVGMQILTYNNNYYILQKIQSTKPINEVENLLNYFNNNIFDLLKTFDIKKYIDILKKDFEEIYDNLSQLYDNYYEEIISRDYLFNKNKLLLNQCNKINYQDLLYFVKKYFNNDNLIKLIILGN